MPTKQTRLTNLRQLIKREGAVSQLALRLQISPIYIYRVLDGKFNIGDSMARKIEDAYGFPSHWMDAVHDDDDDMHVRIPTLETIESERTVQPADHSRSTLRSEMPVSSGVMSPPPSARTAATPPSMPAASPEYASHAQPGPIHTPENRPSPTPAVASPLDEGAEDDPRDRVIATLVHTLDRLLITYNLDLSDLEKARILMKAAEAILDSGSGVRSHGTSPKSVLKIS